MKPNRIAASTTAILLLAVTLPGTAISSPPQAFSMKSVTAFGDSEDYLVSVESQASTFNGTSQTYLHVTIFAIGVGMLAEYSGPFESDSLQIQNGNIARLNATIVPQAGSIGGSWTLDVECRSEGDNSWQFRTISNTLAKSQPGAGMVGTEQDLNLFAYATRQMTAQGSGMTVMVSGRGSYQVFERH